MASKRLYLDKPILRKTEQTPSIAHCLCLSSKVILCSFGTLTWEIRIPWVSTDFNIFHIRMSPGARLWYKPPCQGQTPCCPAISAGKHLHTNMVVLVFVSIPSYILTKNWHMFGPFLNGNGGRQKGGRRTTAPRLSLSLPAP